MNLDAAKSTPSVRNGMILILAALLFFFVSGACGLLYQVVWTRKLVLLFGTTSYAVSTVLSIFFLGLGVGSLWGGKIADRTASPLRVYGLFEIIIGIWAVVFILFLMTGEGAVVALLKTFGGGRGSGILLRAVLALLLLFVPVTLMGATLPLLAKYVNRESRVRGLKVGALYTVNTLGAVCGCLFTGFYLLPRFGYSEVTLLGAAANVLVGVVALVLGRHALAPPPEEVEEPRPEGVQDVPLRNGVIAAFATAGFCGLALEVLWTRLLGVVFLGTTYAYATMLGTLLCGIAIGSAAASLIADRIRSRCAALGAAIALTGLGALWSLSAIAALPDGLSDLMRDSGRDWTKLVQGKFWLSFKALIVPTFFMGMTFPLAVRALGSARERLGRDVGRLYAANTFGGVLGAMAGGFLIIPTLGTHWGILTLALVLALAGSWLIRLDRVITPKWRNTSAAFFLLAILGAAFSGTIPEDVNAALNKSYVWQDHEVIAYKEGVEATVTVTQKVDAPEGKDRVLMINGVQATASIEKGVKMNRLQGVLPLVFDRDPKSVLFMCFGSGITAGTLALSDFDRIDAVEISPDVLGFAPLFEADNLGVIERDSVRFHIDDGRNFLLTTDAQYDVITFEPMPLALAGVSTFYTIEYYVHCLEKLAPGGIVSQWVPMHSLNPEIVRSLVATFNSAFPYCSAWFINADLFLMGSNAPMQIDPARLAKHLENPELRTALADVGFHDAASIIGSFLMDKEGITAYSEGERIMTDDRPWAEFLAPKTVYERTVQDTLDEIIPHVAPYLTLLDESTVDGETFSQLETRFASRRNDLVGVRGYYGSMMIDSHLLEPFKESLAIDPGNSNARFYVRQLTEALASRHLSWDELDKAEDLLISGLHIAPDAEELHLILADVYAAAGRTEEAQDAYAKHLAYGGAAVRDFSQPPPE